MTQLPPRSDELLKMLRILFFALLMGALVFTAIVVVVPMFVQPRQQILDEPIIAYLGAFFAVSAIIAALVVPNLIVKSQRAAPPIDQQSHSPFSPPLNLYHTRVLIRQAILEGGIFFNAALYFVDRNPLSLACIAALFLFFIAGYPSETKLLHFLENLNLKHAEPRS